MQFPTEFNPYDFPSSYECAISIDFQKTFAIKPCEYTTDNIVRINVGFLNKGELSLVVGEVKNPMTVKRTSQFKIRSLYDDVIIDHNDLFGVISLTNPPG